MKDYQLEFEHDGKKLLLVFNLNVMEAIQQEYGSVQEWGDLTDSTPATRPKGPVMKGVKGKSDAQVAAEARAQREPDAKALIFGFREMVNEGNDIMNEQDGGDRPELSLRQTGRLVTSLGLDNVADKIQNVVKKSAKDDKPKNASSTKTKTRA